MLRMEHLRYGSGAAIEQTYGAAVEDSKCFDSLHARPAARRVSLDPDMNKGYKCSHDKNHGGTLSIINNIPGATRGQIINAKMWCAAQLDTAQ